MATACAQAGPADLQQIADDAAADRGGYGFMVAVTNADGKRTVGSAGTDAEGAPLTAEATWRIASVTKMFTAVAVMQLVEEGLIDLDAPVDSYLTSEVATEDVTIRQLLHHSSGVPDYQPILNEVARSCPEQLPDPLTWIEGEPALFDPGSDWSYSNSNYLILGQIINAVSGEHPAAVIRAGIIDPLHLEDTYLEWSEPGTPPVPAVADFYDTGFGPITCATPLLTGADGAMVSSVDDLDTFLRALFDGELVSEKSLEAMLDADLMADNPSGYGLGVMRLLEPPAEGIDLYGHGGGVVGYKTLALYDVASGTTVIAMTPTGRAFDNEQDAILEWTFQP